MRKKVTSVRLPEFMLRALDNFCAAQTVPCSRTAAIAAAVDALLGSDCYGCAGTGIMTSCTTCCNPTKLPDKELRKLLDTVV